MKLQELTLRNFKGVKSFTLKAGTDVSIFGDNATGKTTIVDAVQWLLFDKDSQDQKKFEIKPLIDGVPVTNTECEVEGTFVNGSTVKLRKVFKEKWTKKRGSASTEFTGNTTDYYIDDVPKSAGEYKAKVAELATREDVFKLLTSTTAFTSLHWQKQREMLLEVCGDISDGDVIASNSDLVTLPVILDGKTCDDRKKIIAGQRKKINDDLKSIPDRIDEQVRSKPELTVTNSEILIKKLSTLRGSLSAKVDEIANLKAGGGIVEKRQAVVDIDNRLANIATEHTRNSLQDINLKRDTVAGYHRSKFTVESTTLELQRHITQKHSEVSRLQQLNTNLGQQYDALLASKPTIEHDCPTCGQAMPAGKINEAIGNFNQALSGSLATINKQGVENKGAIERLQKELFMLEAELRAKETTLLNINNDILSLESEITKAETVATPVEDIPEYKNALALKAKAQQELADIQEDSSAAVETATIEKKSIEEEIAVQEKHLSLIEQVHKADDRIAELKEQEKKLATEFETLERHLYLIEQFIRTKVSMLEEKINDKFELVSFRLFKEQINEGLQEVCEVTVGGVPYNSLNSAGKVQAGLDIIKTLSGHYKFWPMIFVDNRESVTSLPEMDAQVISLIVSEPDKELRVVNA